MINIIDKHKCCGCAACVQCCPKECISLQEDSEGFLYPKVNQTLCVDCGGCEKICPALNPNESVKPLSVWAAYNKDESKRIRSSSGGLFIALAERVIVEDGVVFGCVFDEKWETHHVKAETKDSLVSMMCSKYVQSRIENTFIEAKKELATGRKVLFVGTPCQIFGLNKFLRKRYDNLLCVDFICHGTPSPGIWRQYLTELTTKIARSAIAGKNLVLSLSLKSTPVITGVNFRDKNGYGWKKYGFVVRGKSPVEGDKNMVLSSVMAVKDPFFKGFLSNIYLRPSCYQCFAKEGRSMSDITLADFWDIDKVMPNVTDDDKGYSLLFINTLKGASHMETLDIQKMETSFEDAIKFNQSYYKSVNEPSYRSYFFKILEKEKCFMGALEKYYNPPFITRLKRYIKNII